MSFKLDLGRASSRCVLLLTGLGTALPGMALAQTAPAADDTVLEEIIVTGFRKSLSQALVEKRESAAMVDVIVAEDIAKFPDQNLAESLQRVPGVTIERESGEGRRISVRGLGAQFTTVRVNGLQTIAAGSDNGERSFDFNIFASELFSSLVVRKSAEASVDEGSLGAVVDLNTGNPLSGPSGFRGAVNVQSAWNSNTEKVKPRTAALLSYKAPSGLWGASASVAYSKTLSRELGHDTVRWAQASFDSVNGTRCFTQPNAGGTYIPSTACTEAALAFHPRIPRYVDGLAARERLGTTASFQMEPAEGTRLSVDALYSKFDEKSDFRTAEVLFRGNERAIDVTNYKIREEASLLSGIPNRTLVSGTFSDAWVRTERYQRDMNSDFYQFSGRLEQDIGDNIRVNVLAGTSRSDSSSPRESTMLFDDRDAAGFFYDYTDASSPVIRFGDSVTTPANFQLSEIRDQVTDVVNKFNTLKGDVAWDANDTITLSGGGFYRRYSFDMDRSNRNTQVCVNRRDVVLGTLACSGTNIGPGAIYGYTVTSALADLYTLPKAAGAPSGTTTQWLVPNLGAGAAFTGLYNRPLVVDSGSTRGVVERVSGGYLQFDAKGDIADMPYTLNAGLRYARTEQTSQGINSGTVVTVKRTYDDWLPAANATLEPVDDVILRAAYAHVLTRPNLGDLTPGGTVDGFNYRVTFGNPDLDPFRAKSYDLALEWYFQPQSLFSIAYFNKDVKSFPIASVRTGTFASTGLPLSVINASSPAAANPEGAPWTINSRTSGAGATIDGFELGFQTELRFLPGFLENLGVITNATFVSSSAVGNVSAPGTAVSANGSIPLTQTTLKQQFFGLSKRSYNGTLYYEDTVFSARVSVTHRSPFLTSAGTTGNVNEGTAAGTYVDASTSYKLTDSLTLSLEGINLTNELTYNFADEASGREVKTVGFGRTITLGARYSF